MQKPNEGEVLELIQNTRAEYDGFENVPVDPHKRYDAKDNADPYGAVIDRFYQRGVKIFGGK